MTAFVAFLRRFFKANFKDMKYVLFGPSEVHERLARREAFRLDGKFLRVLKVQQFADGSACAVSVATPTAGELMLYVPGSVKLAVGEQIKVQYQPEAVEGLRQLYGFQFLSTLTAYLVAVAAG
jgi:hypothetical protein